MGLGGAFLSAAFPGLLKFLIAGLEDSLVTAKQFILRGDVTDPGVQAQPTWGHVALGVSRFMPSMPLAFSVAVVALTIPWIVLTSGPRPPEEYLVHASRMVRATCSGPVMTEVRHVPTRRELSSWTTDHAS